MKSTMMHYPLTLNHILERAGKLYGPREIVSRMADRSLHRYTYSDFYLRTRRLAQALQQAGIKKGDRVATLMWNSYAHMECYFGIPAIGAVLHTLNLRLFAEDIAFIANHAEDRFVIVDDVLLPLFEQFKDKVKFERVFVFSLSGKPIPAGYESYEELLKTAKGNFQYPDIEENEPCGMCYTSGTTGQPKGVVYSHRSTILHAFMSAMPDSGSYQNSDCVLPVVPMFHANAWAIPYICAMVGAKFVFPGPFLDGESLLELYEKEQVTVSAGVPTIWLGLLQTLQQNPGKWQLVPGMRMTVGGSALPASLIKAYAELDLELIQGWGMTEISPIATISRLDRNTRKGTPDERAAAVARQGLIVPFVDIRIMGDEGEAPWDGQAVGEVQVRGPWVTGSYHNLEKSEESFTADGWLKTGDVGMIGTDGYLRLTDRAKDLIKSGGEWISSVDLENSIMGHPAVAEAAVIAVPHPKWDERPLAVVMLKSSQNASVEEIRDFLLAKYAKWQVPDGIVFVDAIPRTSTGKFLKTKLRETYRDWKW